MTYHNYRNDIQAHRSIDEMLTLMGITPDYVQLDGTYHFGTKRFQMFNKVNGWKGWEAYAQFTVAFEQWFGVYIFKI